MNKLLNESSVRTLVRSLIVESAYLGKKSPVVVAGQTIFVEVADTDPSRSLGLMFRHRIEPDSGMLFIFESCEERSFWMKNTYVPISIAYADRAGKIINIEQMKPKSLDQVYSKGPAMYALEMEDGWFKRNNIGIGDIISI
jgi:uncharacterized membrane protein (UPF0127 family)